MTPATVASIIPLLNLSDVPVDALYTFSSVLEGIDADGHVAGNAGGYPVLWFGSAPIALTLPAGAVSGQAYGTNGGGIVTGEASFDGLDMQPVAWIDGVPTVIGAAGQTGQANGANAAGQVVGAFGSLSFFPSSSNTAFLWQNGVLTDLPNPAGYAGSNAFAINSAGQIVGTSVQSNDQEVAVLWQNGAPTILAPGSGVAINEAGQVVINNQNQVYLWQNGQAALLPGFADAHDGAASGLNDAGIVVGHVEFDAYPLITDQNIGQAEHAVMWQDGAIIDLNSLLPANSGWVLIQAVAINDKGQITGEGLYDGVAVPYVLTLGSPVPALSVTDALAEFAAAPKGAELAIADGSANVAASFAALTRMAESGGIYSITLTDAATPTFSLTGAELSAYGAALEEIRSPFQLSLTSATTVAAVTPTVLDHVATVAISDSAADVVRYMANLESLAGDNQLGSIALTDAGTATFSFSDALTVFGYSPLGEDWAGWTVLSRISTPYTVNVTSAPVADVASLLSEAHIGLFSVSDQSTAILADLDTLQRAYDTGHLSTIQFSDDGTPTDAISAAQLDADRGALSAITSDFTLTVSLPDGAASIAGLAGQGNMLALSGKAADYSEAADGEGGIVLTGASGAIHATGFEAVQFQDATIILAAAPDSDGSVTSGNITELYSAVLAREPDVAGLSYYDAYLAAHPGTGLLQFAEWFLASAEYTGNWAHRYAQTTTGETQFITDSYQNLLGRAPAASDVSFYLSKVIQPSLAGLTAGTAAYAAADTQAHAQMLVYFSASAEFLGDVQVTAQHPASAQHWLVLV